MENPLTDPQLLMVAGGMMFAFVIGLILGRRNSKKVTENPSADTIRDIGISLFHKIRLNTNNINDSDVLDALNRCADVYKTAEKYAREYGI